MQFAQANRTNQKLQKSLLFQRSKSDKMNRQTTYKKEGRTANKVLPKAGLNGFDWTFVLKIPRLRQYPNRYLQPYGDSANLNRQCKKNKQTNTNFKSIN